MIKILHVISDKNIGGAGRLLLNLLAESNRKKFEISVVLPLRSLLSPRISKLGIKAIESDLSMRDLLKIIREKKPDIVHTHAAAKARIAARLCGIYTVNTRHCAEDYKKTSPLYKRIIVRAFDALFTDSTIATADYVKKVLTAEGIPPQKSVVIINGSQPLKEFSDIEKADVRRRLGCTENDFIAGMIARMELGKGQEYFIKAAEICKKKHINVKFFLVGDGSMANELKAMASGLENVKFLGFLSDVTEIMNILDANVNCSYVSETSSLSLSEGMSVGAVPIVSYCGGNSFMAENCGIVFPKKDSEALAEALIFLSNNPEKGKILSNKAKQRFHNIFTAEKMARETENLYLRLLK